MLCCKYCKKIIGDDRKSTLAHHENFCKLNPNHKVAKSPWNKGLTKETDERVLNNSLNASKSLKETGGCWKGKHLPKEMKEAISKGMKGNKNYNIDKTGRGKKGRYKGIPCASTYELAYLIYCLDHNISIKRFKGFYTYEYKGEKHRYYPDFEMADGSLVEIKGFWTELVDIKAASVMDRNLTILYPNDLVEVFNYIKEKYNKIVDVNISDLYDHKQSYYG